MWSLETHWFDASVAAAVLLVGNILFGRFVEHRPRWRRLVKAAVGVALYLFVAVLFGRAWAFALTGRTTGARRGPSSTRDD